MVEAARTILLSEILQLGLSLAFPAVRGLINSFLGAWSRHADIVRIGSCRRISHCDRLRRLVDIGSNCGWNIPSLRTSNSRSHCVMTLSLILTVTFDDELSAEAVREITIRTRRCVNAQVYHWGGIFYSSRCSVHILLPRILLIFLSILMIVYWYIVAVWTEVDVAALLGRGDSSVSM